MEGLFERWELTNFFFLYTFLGFTPFWDYKPTNAIHTISPGVYTSDKIFFLSTFDKIHLKCVVIDGSVVNGSRQWLLYGLVLDRPPGYKLYCEPEAIHDKKVNIPVLNTITFFIEIDIYEEVNLNGETFTFKLKLIKLSAIIWVFKNLKLIVIALVKNSTLVQKILLVRQQYKKTGRVNKL